MAIYSEPWFESGLCIRTSDINVKFQIFESYIVLCVKDHLLKRKQFSEKRDLVR